MISMRRTLQARSCLAILLAVAAVFIGVARATAQEATERRFGLVVGNSEYQHGSPVPTAANDAGLIAQTLQSAGFDVMGARDLDGDALRQTFRDFVQKVSEAGPDAVAVVYLAGHGIQFEGENFFIPIDARIERDVDVPLQALRLSDYVRPLAAMRSKAIVVVLDAARDNPFARGGQPIAGGLALMEPQPGVLYAFNAAPGTIGRSGEPPYGPYAEALAEMIREGGLPLDRLFDRVRLRVHERTSGAEVPWHASQIRAPFMFFERAADAPPEISHDTLAERRSRPVRSFAAEEAYLAALERDTLDGYLEFLQVFPGHPQAGRVRAIVAARREAIVWRKTRNADTPEAYWSYLDRYPKGPHAWDARRRLAYLTAPLDPPPRYTVYEYDLPPPPPEEIVIIERRPVVYFADPYWRFAPLAVVPLLFLPPRPMYFRPPPPPYARYMLPAPAYVPMARHVRAPLYVAPPPNNALFTQIRNQSIVPPPPPVRVDKSPSPGAVQAPLSAGTVATPVALPPSVARRAGPQSPGSPPPGGPPPPGSTQPGSTQPSLPQPIAAPPPGTPGSVRPPLPPTALPQPPAVTPPAVKGPPLPPPTANLPPPGAPPGVKPAAPVTSPPPPAAAAPPAVKSPPLPAPAANAPQAPPPGAGRGTPPQATPPSKAAAGTPPPAPPSPPTQAQGIKPTLPPSPPPQAPARQERLDRAQQDRGRIEQGLQQQRQQEMERRRQEEAARAQARQSQQLQDLQRQRQQQQEQQRRAMEQQRQQQVQQQQQQRQLMMQQQQQAAQQAQAQARARAEAEARARSQQQQQQQKRCGAPGLPPCPPPPR